MLLAGVLYLIFQENPMSMRSHYCGQVTADLVGQEVTVTGWVHRRRDHGGVIFIDLRDREGLLQLVLILIMPMCLHKLKPVEVNTYLRLKARYVLVQMAL